MSPEAKKELREINETLDQCITHLSIQARPDAFGPAKVIDLIVLHNVVKSVVTILLTKE